MPDLLLELFSEEIPARMQRRAAEDLRKAVTDALVEAGFVYEGAKAFATPRRLALTVSGVPARSADQNEEKRGPRVGAPDAAIAGFLKSTGLASLDQATIQSDPKKGDYYIAVVKRPGRGAGEVIAEAMPKIIRTFPWPKSMRWGEASARPGALSWVRPLQSILCTFGPETEDPEIVDFAVDSIASSDLTYGHRFMAPVPIRAKRFDDYQEKLEAGRVVLDADRRKDIILADAKNLAFAKGLALLEDEGLLEEVAGLVEWPVVLVGSFDESYLDIPPEVIRATIRANQKCFVVEDAKTGKLSNHFLLVANIEASDGGEAIVAGNERVIRARLSDARYFWETDLKPLPAYHETRLAPLDQRLKKLRDQNIVFHEKLGTQGERVDRIVRLAETIAPQVGADPRLAARAAELAKADLTSEMVGEFPELQGLMGRYYATKQGEHASVAAAAEDHYKPLGPGDRVPTDPVSVSVSLADKLDILVGFWSIDEKPTGSKDPYALRRAALGVIRVVLTNGLRLKLSELGAAAIGFLELPVFEKAVEFYEDRQAKVSKQEVDGAQDLTNAIEGYEANVRREQHERAAPVLRDLVAFLFDRLKVQLREQGARHDLVDAVLALGAEDDLVLIVRRVEALGKFLDSEDGRNLLAGYKRAANILRAEEKGGETFSGDVEPRHLVEAEEKLLAEAVEAARAEAAKAVAKEDFEAAMSAMANLRKPLDAFFEKVLVNAPDKDVRSNRLRLLNRIREATRTVADFSKVAG